MRAIVMDGFGDESVLVARAMPVPEPGPGQLLVEIHAGGLNPADYKIRSGHLADLFPVRFPRILGGDVSGVVRVLGAGAGRFSPGDEVFFSLPLDGDGGYAEYCVVDEALVAAKPASLRHTEAASLPVAGLTSVQALRDFAGLKAGQKVLVHAGAGGVGAFAVQYAKYLGAEVFATASGANREFLLSLGVDRVIDYRTEDFVEVARAAGGMDAVLDTLGGPNLPRSIRATRRGGAVPCIVNPPDEGTRALAAASGVRTDFFLLHGSASDLAHIAALVEAGRIRPFVSRTLPLEQAREGHRLLESGRTRGKIVLEVR